jgi:ABC-type lipoprotein export system ATPase subunit
MTAAITFNAVSYSNYLENVSFEIEAGSSTLIITSRVDENTALFQLISGLVKPHQGSVRLHGQNINELSQPELNTLRHSIGIVPANGGLVSNLKMWENITLPLLYSKGAVSAEETENGYAYLTKLNSTGNIMALPAHLSTYEKRMTAFVRGALKQSDIMIYSNCFDAIPGATRKNFLSVIKEFQNSSPARTSLFISTNAEVASELPIDSSFSIH